MVDLVKIGDKWQKKWEKAKIFASKENPKKKKLFVLEMFAYPSGAGIHMGHAKNYSIGDAYARFKRMNGFNVLYPAGFDAFGLPAENAAIKHKVHPEKWTMNNIKLMTSQFKKLGLSYDWSRLVITCLPGYYKWNQWIFLKLYERGMVYRKESEVNWCPSCNTVLANEQVINGECWRCKSKVEPKDLEQWFFRITNYADELLEELDSLDWPDRVKLMQRNWIGRSYGTEIIFRLKNTNDPIVVFTTRPDTVFGVTALIISPENHMVLDLVRETPYEKKVKEFVERVKQESFEARIEKEKEGLFIGKYAINPLNNEEIPIYTANFVLPDYGTGIIMCVPAHDQRDFEFAKKYHLPIKIVIQPKEINCIIVHGCPSNAEKSMDPKTRTYDKHWIPWIKKELIAKGTKVETPLMPTPWEPDYENWKKEFDKLEVNENTILIGHSCGSAFLVRWLGEAGKNIHKLILVAPWKINENNEIKKKFYEYQINPKVKSQTKEITIFTADNEEEDGKKSLKIFHNVLNGKIIELNGRGHYTFNDMKTERFPELLNEVLEMNEAHVGSGILINSNEFNGMSNDIAIKEISDYIVRKDIGRKTVNYKLKDWLISRQRYWGTPIPMIHCRKCGIIPIPEKSLPVKLPKNVKFTGHGNPLEHSAEFVRAKCPKCRSDAKKETDTMDTFVDSSWYFLRYCSPKFSKLPFDKSKVKYWLPVDKYIGGIEHAVLHLLYARFFTKALRDLKLLGISEPFNNLLCHGMVTLGGFAMSKSKGNVVDPIDIIKKYGPDTCRVYILFVASPEKELEWNDEGVNGVFKFLNKFYSLIEKHTSKDNSKDKLLETRINILIKEVAELTEAMLYNIVITKIIEFVNFLHVNKNKFSSKHYKESLEKLILITSPFAPHICEEMWEKLGKKGFTSTQKYPKYNDKKIDNKLLEGERIVKSITEDINNLIKLIKFTPKKAKLYLSEDWKYLLFNKLKDEKSRNVGELMKKYIDNKHNEEIKKIIFSFSRGNLRIYDINKEIEKDNLMNNVQDFENKFNIKVEIHEAENSPEQKAKNALPGKPAIVLE